MFKNFFITSWVRPWRGC